jgi:hypothetical protein
MAVVRYSISRKRDVNRRNFHYLARLSQAGSFSSSYPYNSNNRLDEEQVEDSTYGRDGK